MSRPKGKKRSGVCAYTGRWSDNLSRDHVPPKCLFPTERSNPITVPCCDGLNKRASQDDEYFRLVLCAESKVGEHPEAARAASIAAKSLWRPEAKGFRDAFLRAVKVRDVVSPKGIYTGRAPSYDVDYRRIHSVVERITLGLYFWEFEQPMPSELAVSVLDGMSINRSPKTEREAVERIAGKFAGSDFHSRAGGCFKFARKSIDESVGHIWSMRFFDGFDFIAAAYDQREHGPMYYGPEYVDELRYDSRGT